jgi:hypothetical protein
VQEKLVDFETKVKMKIYRTIAETTKAPSAEDVSRHLGVSIEEAAAAFYSLHQKRLLVPEPDDPMKIRMAPPFSGIETAFRVRCQGRAYYANCVWDALGIPAALHADAVIETIDAQTGESMRIEVRKYGPVPQQCVIHFAVPAALWWDDIVHT